MEYFLVMREFFFNSSITTALNAVGILGHAVLGFLVETFHMFSTDSPLTASYLARIMTHILCAVAATILWEEGPHGAEIKSLREDFNLAQARHSSNVDDLTKHAEMELSDAEMVLDFTRKDLQDAETGLEQTQKIASAHLEFREALAKELARMRAQRDWAARGMKDLMDALAEARRKDSSQELVAYEMQSQIKFKANELRDMTLSLENIKKELVLANTFSKEAQDEIDEQRVKIGEQEELIENKEKTILCLMDQIKVHTTGWRRMQSTTNQHNQCVNSVITQLEKMNGDLAGEVKYWRGMSQNWSTNNANTIHAMGSEIAEARSELAMVNAENERLTRDLKAMVEQVEGFDKEREAMTQRVEQLDRNVIALEAARKEEKSYTEDVDISLAMDEEEQYEDEQFEEEQHEEDQYEEEEYEEEEYEEEEYEEEEYEEEEYEEEEDLPWIACRGSEDDATLSGLDGDGEEAESEWLTQTSIDAMDADGWRIPTPMSTRDSTNDWWTEHVTLVREPDEWIENIDGLANSEDKCEDNDSNDSWPSDDETLATDRVEDEDEDLVLVSYWECDSEPMGQLNW